MEAPNPLHPQLGVCEKETQQMNSDLFEMAYQSSQLSRVVS